VRSTWDYTTRRDEFLAWARHVDGSTRLANPAATIAWNTDKRYLADLAAAGVPVVPTTYLAPGDPEGVIDAAVSIEGDVVVKPTISAGARDTVRHRSPAADPARRHAAELLAAGREVMVQPYLDAVERHHETGIVFADGGYVHAFAKAPLLVDGSAHVEGLWAHEEIAPRHPEPDELEVAEQALRVAAALTGSVPLYARVDLVRDASGAPVVLELELTEPSFFLNVRPGAAARIAAAFVAQARRR
jgi:glutathione synthase/RimK-type ligase-like ATP-grasp enzyme